MSNDKNDYLNTFPFNTCEMPDKKGLIKQPYSLFFNIINCFIILFFLIQTKNIYSFFFLLSIFLFQLLHSFSHSIHIPGFMQTNIVHVLAYLVNFSFFIFLYNYAGVMPDNSFLIYFLSLVCVDIYSMINTLPIFYYSTQALMFVSLLIYYYVYLPLVVKNNIILIVILFCISILLLINEKYNCKDMLLNYGIFPYHIFIEIVGLFLFYIICSSFYKL